MGKAAQRIEVLEDAGLEAGWFDGEQVGTVQWHSSDHARIIAVELGAEVEPLLVIRHSRGQLAAEWEPTPPGTTPALHRHLRLVLLRQGEERSRQFIEPLTEAGVDSVADHGEEPDALTGTIDGRRHRHGTLGPLIEQRKVDHRQRIHIRDRPSHDVGPHRTRWQPEASNARVVV